MINLKIGDLVQLKDKKIQMTIEHIIDEYAICTWIKKNEIKTDKFIIDSLKLFVEKIPKHLES